MPATERSEWPRAFVGDAAGVKAQIDEMASALDVDEFWRNIVEGVNSITEVPPERFSWNDAPLQSRLKSLGRTWAAMRSISAIASPELTPGLPPPRTCTAGRLLKRVIVPGPLVYSMRASERSGIISPFALLT
jgi:hypothetical protein